MRPGFEASQAPHRFEVRACVADGFGELSKQNDRAVHSGARQSASQRGAVTSVIASAAKNERFFVRQVAVQPGLNCIEARAAGGFHEQEGGGVIVLDSETVNLADLFGGEYGLHVSDDRERRGEGSIKT